MLDDMQGNIDSNVEQLKQICSDLQVTDNVSYSRSKQDSLDEARTKVANKLRNNAAYLQDSANVSRPDPVYKQHKDGKFAVGIKYGNRYLQNIFNGRKYVANISKEALPAMLETLAVQAEQKQYDAAIEVVRAANVNTRSNVKH
jgi:hypothetical protein